MREQKCGKPEDLPVLFSGPEQWALLTSPTYLAEHGVPHVHRWPTRECSLLVQAE